MKALAETRDAGRLALDKERIVAGTISAVPDFNVVKALAETRDAGRLVLTEERFVAGTISAALDSFVASTTGDVGF